jgi:hypothetical protein
MDVVLTHVGVSVFGGVVKAPDQNVRRKHRSAITFYLLWFRESFDRSKRD